MRFMLNIPKLSALSVLCLISSVSGADLTGYQWKNRLLLIFAPTESVPAYEAVDKNLADSAAEVTDRDLIVIRVFKDGPSRIGEALMSSTDARELYRRFRVKSDRFTAILIGKDGGTKMVREYQVNLKEVFALIDSMPMRQQEVRQKDRTQ